MRKIHYFGDDDPQKAAAYLAGVLSHHKIPFTHVPGERKFADAVGDDVPAGYVFSDYPSKNLTERDMRKITADVNAGAGFLMIGGWESFHGLNGEYGGGAIEKILPVEIACEDDRFNSPQPCMIKKCVEHPVLGALPFDAPPAIGGLNILTPRTGAEIVLEATTFRTTFRNGVFDFAADRTFPLLVLGTFGAGRTAAFATDVAPHWVGGFVDWGTPRVWAQACGANPVEVGCHYAGFFANLVKWIAKID